MKRVFTLAAALLAAPAAAQTTTTQCRTDQWGNTNCTSEKAPGIDWSLGQRQAPPPSQPAPPPRYLPPVYIPPTVEADDPGPGVPFDRGNQFVRLCASNKWQLSCMAYTMGVYHGSQPIKETVCKPDGVDGGQLYNVALRYISDHPEIAHRAAFSLILESWEKTFPCTT